MNENAKNDTALMEIPFRLPDVASDNGFTSDELAEDMDGLRLSLPKVKIPAGGSLQFELPGGNPDDPEYAKTLQGIIVYQHSANAYWPDGNSEDENVSPACSSNDGRCGVGTPGGACDSCGLNAWGSGESGKGKACKNMRQLYLLRDGDYLPINLTLPPTSIRPYTDFASTVFSARGRGTCGSLVEIGLKRVDNNVNVYSVATFSKIADFSGEMLAQIKVYAASFKAQIKNTMKQQVADAELSPYDMDSYGSAPYDADPAYAPAAMDVGGYGEQEVPDLPFGPTEGEVINGDAGQIPA